MKNRKILKLGLLAMLLLATGATRARADNWCPCGTIPWTGDCKPCSRDLLSALATAPDMDSASVEGISVLTEETFPAADTRDISLFLEGCLRPIPVSKAPSRAFLSEYDQAGPGFACLKYKFPGLRSIEADGGLETGRIVVKGDFSAAEAHAISGTASVPMLMRGREQHHVLLIHFDFKVENTAAKAELPNGNDWFCRALLEGRSNVAVSEHMARNLARSLDKRALFRLAGDAEVSAYGDFGRVDIDFQMRNQCRPAFPRLSEPYSCVVELHSDGGAVGRADFIVWEHRAYPCR